MPVFFFIKEPLVGGVKGLSIGEKIYIYIKVLKFCQNIMDSYPTPSPLIKKRTGILASLPTYLPTCLLKAGDG